MALLQTLVATGAVVFSLRLGADVTKPSIDEGERSAGHNRERGAVRLVPAKGSLLPAGIPLLADVVFCKPDVGGDGDLHPSGSGLHMGGLVLRLHAVDGGVGGSNSEPTAGGCGVSHCWPSSMPR